MSRLLAIAALSALLTSCYPITAYRVGYSTSKDGSRKEVAVKAFQAHDITGPFSLSVTPSTLRLTVSNPTLNAPIRRHFVYKGGILTAINETPIVAGHSSSEPIRALGYTIEKSARGVGAAAGAVGAAVAGTGAINAVVR